MSASVLCDLLLLVFVTAAAVSDLSRRKIPNRLVLAGLLAAFCLHGALAAPSWLWDSLGGMATGFFLLLPLYLLRGMAAGDVKLIAMVGAFAGPRQTLLICFATFVLGGLMALLLVTWQGSWRVCVRNLHQLLWPLASPPASHASVGNMPYGLAIALGTLLIQGRNYC